MGKNLRVAIVHDYLIDFGGAEQVLLSLHEMYRDAPIFTAIYDRKLLGNFAHKFDDVKIKTTWFGYLPHAARLISPLRFLLPLIWGSLDLSSYDVIIDSSSWAVTRGFKSRRGQVEICYCHTPPRYLYGLDTSRKWKNKRFSWLVFLYASIVNRYMRRYDFMTAKKVDVIIANSQNTKLRIKKYWQRDAQVIYPPVNVEEFSESKIKPISGTFFLTGGRLVAAKNFELIIKACQKAGVKLKIFGSGVLESSLKVLAGAGDSVEFLGKISNERVLAYYKGALAFIAAQRDEDFGMTLVEAQAVGCPVVCYRGGGYLETVREGKTGVFFDELTVESLTDALSKVEKHIFDKRLIRDHAKQFGKAVFQEKMRALVTRVTCDAGEQTPQS